MAKHDENTGPVETTGFDADKTQAEQDQPADGGGLRQRTEQELAERAGRQQAEQYAPPAGEGPRVNPDVQRNDPDGEAQPTA